MGSTILIILTTIGGLLVLAGLVALVAWKLRWFRVEKATERIPVISEPSSGAAVFAKAGVSGAALTAESAVERGAARLRETSVAVWASRVIVLNAPVINIGRSLKNDIVLPEDPVSAEHCRLERQGATFRLTDLRSTNRTFVNGRKVDTAILRNGDEIRVGKTTFVFECAEV